MRLSILFLLLFTFSTSSQLNAKPASTYKYVDENGKTVYSDKVPLNPSKQGITEMSKQGLIIKKAESEEQKQQRLIEEAKRREEEQKLIAARRKDRALLDAFSSVKQIEQKRDRSIETVQISIDAFQARQKNIQKRLSDLKKDSQGFLNRKKPIPVELVNNINVAQRELNEVNSKIQDQQKATQQIRLQASQDIKRYIELTTPNNASTQ